MLRFAAAVLCLLSVACGTLYSPVAIRDEDIDTAKSLKAIGSGGGETDTTENVDIAMSAIDTSHYGAAIASIEERVYLADVIVRATLVSSANDLLSFNAVEYLKGTGPASFTVSASTTNRNSQWDGNEAILFLSGRTNEGGTRSTSATFDFADTTKFSYEAGGPTEYTGALEDGYTIDKANPVWLPSSSSNTRTTNSNAYVAASTPLAGSQFPTVTVADIKRLVAWLNGGEGVVDYQECIQFTLASVRETRDFAAFWSQYASSITWPYSLEERGWYYETLEWESGQAAPTLIKQLKYKNYYERGYSRVWVDGEDAELAVAKTIDEDTDPTNGHVQSYEVIRPLPAGTYEIGTYVQSYLLTPCNAQDHRYNGKIVYTITVTSPAGTVHEAFFDPAGATSVGFDSASGSLKPSAFTANGTTSTITALRYENGNVVLELNPFNALTGLHLLFIEPHGSFGLSLTASSATADKAAGTLTWPLAEVPWEDGDQLLLRITSVAPP